MINYLGRLVPDGYEPISQTILKKAQFDHRANTVIDDLGRKWYDLQMYRPDLEEFIRAVKDGRVVPGIALIGKRAQ